MHAGRFAQRVEVERPGQIRPAAESLIRRYVSPWVRLLFRPRLDGVEKLPESGPYLLVTNHSAGVGLAEILSVVVCWLENPGASRRLAGFALPLGFVVWPFVPMGIRNGAWTASGCDGLGCPPAGHRPGCGGPWLRWSVAAGESRTAN